MNKKNRFRRKALALTTLAACSLFFAASCQKQTLKPEDLTQAELESINQHVIDYALQVIPDIHEVMPLDLIKAMDSIPTGNTLPNGQPEIISALHFGDNPPDVFKMTEHNDTVLGFAANGGMKVVYHIQSDPTKPYYLESGTIRQYTNYFRFYDQHRGVAKYDFKCSFIDMGHDNFICEIAHVYDSVFIMGSGKKFTAYLTQKRSKEHSSGYNPEKPGEREDVILSGEVTSNGIKDFYFAMKIKSYDIPVNAGVAYPNIGDILIFKSNENFLPFVYWNPDQPYNN